MAVEILLTLIMPYPWEYGNMYVESGNDLSNGKTFVVNDILLCIMMFCRVHFILKALIQISYYTDPRA
jgi:hypothetical protein